LGGAEDGEAFGSAVAISYDGTVVAVTVGSVGGGTSSSINNGVVRVYQLKTFVDTLADGTITNEWAQMGADLVAPTAVDGTDSSSASLTFGSSIDLSDNGKVVVIAASDGAHVMEFNEDGGDGDVGEWALVNRVLLPPPPEGVVLAEDPGVSSVSVSAFGDFVAVGISGSATSNVAGYVHVYKLTDGTWSNHGGDSPIQGGMDEVTSGDTIMINPQVDFGHSVSLSGDGQRLVIGAPTAGSTETGQVKVYHLPTQDALEWEQLGDALKGELTGDRTGFSVSLSHGGDLLVVGSPMQDNQASDNVESNAGYARVYMWNPTGEEQWYQVGDDLMGGMTRDAAGFSVSISSKGVVAVGAPGGAQNSETPGYVDIYVRGAEKDDTPTQ
jgi:hypothetical protein